MFKEINYEAKIIIGTPLVSWKVLKNEHNQWLRYKNEITEKFKNATFFTSLEIDNNGLNSYGDFIEYLKNNGVHYWTYMINDNCEHVDYNNRLIRIEMGRNLIREYAQRFHNQDAILCGCIPIIIPNEGVSEETWKNSIDLHKYGHSYGLNDIQHAIETRNQFLQVINEQEQKSIEQTKQFISNCYQGVYGS